MPPPHRSLPLGPWRSIFRIPILERGESYARQSRVSQSVWNPDLRTLSGRVMGSASIVYDVSIELIELGKVWSPISFHCSCGHAKACKHAAALLCAVEQRPDPSPNSAPAPSPNAKAASRRKTQAAAGTPTQPPDAPPLPPLPSSLQQWVKQLTVAAKSADSRGTVEAPERLVYVLTDMGPELGAGFTVHKVSRRTDGTPGRPAPYYIANCLTRTQARFVTAADMRIARRVSIGTKYYVPRDEPLPLAGVAGAELLRELIETGRCYWETLETPPLKPGQSRPGTLAWRRDTHGQLHTSCDVTPPIHRVLNVSPPWFLDTERNECGPLELPVPQAVATVWFDSPPIPVQHTETIQSTLRQAVRSVELPQPPAAPKRAVHDVVPVPTLHVASTRLQWWDSPWGFSATGAEGMPILTAKIRFRYDTVEVDPGDPATGNELTRFDGSELHVVRRSGAHEEARIAQLYRAGLLPSKEVLGRNLHPPLSTVWVLRSPDDTATAAFLQTALPGLRDAGWEITRDPAFELEIVEPTGWFLDSTPDQPDTATDWFDLQVGVQIGDERINLLPVLLAALQDGPGGIDIENLRKRRASETVLLTLPDHRRVPFPARRLASILDALIELHSPRALESDGRLRVHRLRAAELGKLADAPDWTWARPEQLRELAARLEGISSATPFTPPAGLQASLRPYQNEGLRWLQFIRECGIGGVLADDMGLGKTVQTIAHLLLEKEQGRLDRPCLVVSPTSVLGNWADELAKFAPSLRVLALHGSDRHTLFPEMAAAEIILTTYALIHRDAEELRKVDFHAVILDEAQNIKNPRTQAAQVACTLRTRHRLCLTGTPLENHLGELWSLFNFLIPGFLADETRFRALFRNPIEKYDDTARRKQLGLRVRPFMLRRRKDEVATDLPPKTEILRRVDLAGPQRDLYETIRLAMEQRVREEVARKGLSRSHIVILDALLKLRQVCCDPRLVPLESARKVTESAKLELLMEMLPTLLEEGRRILLFSQFTSMLALIQQRLDHAGIPWLTLTGDTTDRATPVRRFQAGEVPLFLISLKAGGTGLNLTAADAVILYDPWWNPAVESQATDRAHRIGQDKPVFVYRLLTTGTVEEKIHTLQEKKRGLVEALLSEGAATSLRLGREELDALFAPIG